MIRVTSKKLENVAKNDNPTVVLSRELRIPLQTFANHARIVASQIMSFKSKGTECLRKMNSLALDPLDDTLPVQLICVSI